jgi:hypothetical protein
MDNQWVNGGQVEADGDKWYEIKGAFKLEKQPSKVTAYVQGLPPGVDLTVMDLQIYQVDRKARFERIDCYQRWRKRREVKEIKPQGDTRFNVENPPNTRGKNHGRQPASNFTMIGVRLQTPTAAAYKK